MCEPKKKIHPLKSNNVYFQENPMKYLVNDNEFNNWKRKVETVAHHNFNVLS